MTFAELTEVWTPLSATIALASGVLFGLVFGWFASNPAHSLDIAGPLRVACMAALFVASAGLIFYAGQTLGSYLSNDPLWFRVMSRYGPWLLFSVAIGVTSGLLIRRDRSIRRHRAHNRAVHELHRDQK